MIARIFGLGVATAATIAPAADVPLESLAQQVAPPPPDYARPESWAARPGREGAASAVPPHATPAARTPAVDVFYVHPTTDRSKAHWNQDVTDAETNGWTDASVIARQASVFNGCCQIYAPRYRQASSRAFAAISGEGAKAYELAYGDVLRAFDHYLAHDNRGRPFILAGHSQGGSHVARLLKDRIDGKRLQRRLVAAYVIGYNLSQGDFGETYKALPPCAEPAQTGCVVQWNATLASPDLAAIARASERRYVGIYGDEPGKTILCVNPLTFDRARAGASKDSSLGAVPGDPGYGAIKPLRPKSVSARCENGLLVVEPALDLGMKSLPGGSMHFHEIGLFYADIRANAALRVTAFAKKRR